MGGSGNPVFKHFFVNDAYRYFMKYGTDTKLTFSHSQFRLVFKASKKAFEANDEKLQPERIQLRDKKNRRPKRGSAPQNREIVFKSLSKLKIDMIPYRYPSDPAPQCFV